MTNDQQLVAYQIMATDNLDNLLKEAQGYLDTATMLQFKKISAGTDTDRYYKLHMLRYFQTVIEINKLSPEYLAEQLSVLDTKILPLWEKKINVIGDQIDKNPSEVLVKEYKNCLARHIVDFDRRNYIRQACRE